MRTANLLFAGALLLGSRSAAQAPVLIDHAPQVGEYSTYAVIGLPATTMLPAGPDQDWDLSTVDTTFLVRHFQFLAAANTPFADDFPTAQIAEFHWAPNVDIYHYLRSGSYGLELLGDGGVSDMESGSAVMPSPERYLPSYCTYATTWTDTTQSCTDSMECPILHLTCEADAYGTLHLPGGTVTSVLRTRCIWTVATIYESHTFVQDRYWHPAFPYYLATTLQDTIQEGNDPPYPTQIDGEVLTDLSVGLAPQAIAPAGLSAVFSGNEQSLAFTLEHAGALDLRVLDGAGRTIHTARLVNHDPSGHRVTVPIPQLSPGIYMLVLEEAGEWNARQPFTVVR